MKSSMRSTAAAAFAAMMAVGGPAQAMEHRSAIDHPDGPIAANYAGTPHVAMRQIGSAGVGGRQDTLRCRWTILLTVERYALFGSGHVARRTLPRGDVIGGTTPGWCPPREHGAKRIAARHRHTLHAALMTMVEQDRALILAEADRILKPAREG